MQRADALSYFFPLISKQIMKKFYYLFVAVATLLLSTACSNKKTQTREEQVEKFRTTLTSSDTTQMLQLCDHAMELLKGKKIDEVVASLYEYNDSTKEVKPLTEAMAKRYTRMFNMFPVFSYSRRYYSFMLEGCNDVLYDVVFAHAEQAGTEKDPTTTYMFNPVKIDDEWKLCVKALNDEIDYYKSFER